VPQRTLRCAPAAGSVKKICLSEASEQFFLLDPAKSAAKPVRDREDGRIDSITIVPSDSLQQHLVAAKFASGTGFLPPIAASSLERDFCRRRLARQKGPEDDVSAQRPEIGDYLAREMAAKATVLLASCQSRVSEDWVVVCTVPCEPVSASQPLLFTVICIFSGTRIPAFCCRRLHALCFSA
jgi:hypothetical protein